MNDVDLTNTYEKLMKVIADENLNSNVEKILEQFNSKVIHKQYGFGGELLHRGYYCPSRTKHIQPFHEGSTATYQHLLRKRQLYQH